MSFIGDATSELSLVKKETVIQIIERELLLLKLIADKYKTQDVCEKAVKMRDWALCFVPNHLKTKKMYKKPIQEDLGLRSIYRITSIPKKSVKGSFKKIHTH